MKIFERDGKINFVDDNNVFVGFSTDQHCCEEFGWALSLAANEPPEEQGANGIDHDGFNFDTEFFNEFYEGDENVAVFKLAKNQQHIYLKLFNHHDGFYTHGFEMDKGGEIIRRGEI